MRVTRSSWFEINTDCGTSYIPSDLVQLETHFEQEQCLRVGQLTDNDPQLLLPHANCPTVEGIYAVALVAGFGVENRDGWEVFDTTAEAESACSEEIRR